MFNSVLMNGINVLTFYMFGFINVDVLSVIYFPDADICRIHSSTYFIS